MAFRTSIFYEIISIIGIFLTSLLIVIIFTKTPVAMKQFKHYLLLYSCHLLGLQIACGIYAPSMLHPYIFFYPMGIAKYFPSNISSLVFVFSFFNAISMYDCIIAMVMKRYYLMKNLNNGNSRIPITVYFLLTGVAYSYLFFSIFVVFFTPLHDYFLLSPGANFKIIENLRLNLDDEIIVDSIIIFHSIKANEMPPFYLLLSVIIGFRLVLIIVYLILNALLSRQLTHHAVSEHLQKNTSMLIKMIAFQFFGITIFVGIPVIIVLSIATFVKQSNSFIGYAFTTLSCFGIWDSIVTIICITPYRNAVLECVKRCLCQKNINTRFNPAIIPISHQSRLPSISRKTEI